MRLTWYKPLRLSDLGRLVIMLGLLLSSLSLSSGLIPLAARITATHYAASPALPHNSVAISELGQVAGSSVSAIAASLTPAVNTISNKLMIGQPESLPTGLYAAWLAQQTEGGEAYTIKLSQTDGSFSPWQASNPAQGLKLEFGKAGVNINDWSMTLGSMGEGTRKVEPSVTANRAEYQHEDGLTEWYVNGPLGLEQGFTLAKPLSHTEESGWLNLPVNFEGVKVQADSQHKDWLKLVGPNGAILGQYGQLYATDASGKVLQSELTSSGDGQQAVLRVKVAGASYPVVIDPFVQQAELTASDGAANDSFAGGVSLSSDGHTALIGALGKNSNRGAAYIYTASGSSWSQQAILTTTNGTSGDKFGIAVALSGDGTTALIGAIGKDSNRGATYIYTGSGSSWSQQAILTDTNGASFDFFGVALSLSNNGNTALIGANNNNNGQGAAFIYARNGSSWSQQTILTASDGTSSDSFGNAVSLSSDGTTALIGALSRNNHQGGAYIYTGSGSSWSQQTILTATNGAANDYFGDAVSLSGDGTTALISAPYKNHYQGTAYIYTGSGSSWNQQTILTATDGAANDNFGYAVSLSSDGHTALIGAFGKSNIQGAAYIYTGSSSSWSQQTILTATDGAANDVFGLTVALSSDGYTALIGASGKNSQRGTAYIFVEPQPTTITLTSSPNPSIVNQTVTFTSSLTPITATGTVTFSEGSSVLGTATVMTGTAIFTTSSLSTGSHVITATYGGNTNYAEAVSQPITQVVSCPAIVTSISDDGTGTTCGTLSYALLNSSSGVTITFALTQGNTITFTGSLTTTAKVKTGVTIYGGAFGSTNRITLYGNNVTGDGLHLAGSNYLYNLTIKKFGGKELTLEGTGNHFQGVVVDAS